MMSTPKIHESFKSAFLSGLLATSALTPSVGEAKPKTELTVTRPLDKLIAETLWGEARGEGVKGMTAVATIIWNRANGDPKKIQKVITAPYQFEYWTRNKSRLSGSDVPKFKVGSKDHQMWVAALSIANQMQAGKFRPSQFTTDPTINNIYRSDTEYYMTNKLWAKPKPTKGHKWIRTLKAAELAKKAKTYKLGNHTFIDANLAKGNPQ